MELHKVNNEKGTTQFIAEYEIEPFKEIKKLVDAGKCYQVRFWNDITFKARSSEHKRRIEIYTFDYISFAKTSFEFSQEGYENAVERLYEILKQSF